MDRILILAGVFLFSRFSIDSNHFFDKASQFNIAEIQAGKLAIKKGSPTLIKLGREMVKYHSFAQSELHGLVQKEGLKTSTIPDAEHDKVLSNLENLSGKAFDSAYIATQFIYYKEAISIFTEESQTGTDIHFKTYAGKHLPKLQMHLQMFQGDRPAMKLSMDSVKKK
jgi:putative membrane protein